MPREPVTITFEINSSKNPKESIYTDNKDSKSISWIRYDIATADYTLYYDELTKELEHELAGGGIPGSVKSPGKSLWRWDGNPAGEYTFTIRTEIYKDEDKETQEHKALVDEVLQSFNYGSNMTYVDKGSNYQLKLEIDDPTATTTADGLLGIKRDYTKEISYELEHSPNSTGSTHPYFKEILEGYDESNTQNSKDNYKYRAYIQDGQHIYKVIEETLVTVTVNQSNKKCYTFGGMKNGKYYMTAWLNDVDVSSVTNVPGMTLKGVNTEKQLDEIALQVYGSMYDDLNN